MTPERIKDVQMEGAPHDDTAIVQSSHFTAAGRLTWGELRDLLATAARAQESQTCVWHKRLTIGHQPSCSTLPTIDYPRKFCPDCGGKVILRGDGRT